VSLAHHHAGEKEGKNWAGIRNYCCILLLLQRKKKNLPAIHDVREGGGGGGLEPKREGKSKISPDKKKKRGRSRERYLFSREKKI